MGDDPSFHSEQIETLLLQLAKSKSDKPHAYSTLLQLQSQSVDEPSAIRALCERLPSLLNHVQADIFDGDEEIAVLALKCLGFFIYYPTLVSAIPENVAYLVVESLVKLIISTKMKAVCNLGVWCISIQQFNISFLESQIDSLLRAVIHALDNPIGSLSTTFEAVQAVMKLATQLNKKMRDMSYIWAPAIYRRLLSSDKRERDISERCLQKIKSCILPPSSTLSKAVYVDIKQKLLPEMKEMLQGLQGQGCNKVHLIQAWGWFVRLLGCHAVKNRHLVNEMLKIPEQTFSNPDPQVQIASQVAWEGLIDVLIQPPIASTRNFENQVHSLCKTIKLIMTPIIPVMSHKCDTSVRLSCFNTWYYMLHKLDVSVNNPSVVKIALEPILEVIFQMGPGNKNLWVWNSCLDLLEDFILLKVKDGCSDSENPEVTSGGSYVDDKGLRKIYPIKWLPWDQSKLDFQLKMLQILRNQGLLATVSSEHRKMALDASVRIFRSVLRGVQVELKVPSRLFDETLLCINTILRFIKETCESFTSKPITIGDYDFQTTVFQLLEAITEEIENSILASPLYSIPLNLKHIGDLQTSINDIGHEKLLGIGSVTYMDMVSPMVYLTVLHLSVVVHSLLNLSEDEMLMQKTQRFSKIIFSAYDLLENLHAIIVFLYMYMHKLNNGAPCLLKIWRVFAEGLKEHIETINNLRSLKAESDSTGNEMIFCFLCYPLAICSSLSFSDLSLVSSLSVTEIELIIRMWKSLYHSANHVSQAECFRMNSFSESVCERLTGMIDGNIGLLQISTEMGSKESTQDVGVLSVLGEIAIFVLMNVQILPSESLKSNKSQKEEDSNCKDSSNIKYSLEFVARVLMFQLMIMKSKGQVESSVVSRTHRHEWSHRRCLEESSSHEPLQYCIRVFSAMACFAGRLWLKQDILLLMEIFSDPLVQWLSSCPISLTVVQDGCPIHELQRFWTQTLDCLQRSQPAIVFDSAFLSVQATLLQTALDHPHPSISDATIKFWNCTYGEKFTLSYPQSLLPVLESHWRRGRIVIRKGSSLFSFNNSSAVKEADPSQRLRVTTTQKTSSRRIEFLEDNEKDLEHFQVPSAAPKRKRLELTEHQREVRRAQQGRERDCNGHGPGVRTYTDVDFSQQGNVESQESEDLRNPDAILELLKRSL